MQVDSLSLGSVEGLLSNNIMVGLSGDFVP